MNDGVRIEYDYDHEGERVARRVYRDGAQEDYERYLIDRHNLTGYSQVVAVIDGQTGAVRRFHDFADALRAQTTFGADPVTLAQTARRDLFQTDALGSVRGLLLRALNSRRPCPI